MDWTTFKSETEQYLWRVGDTHLAANMSKIVRTAENRLRTDIDWTDTDITLSTQITTYPAWSLPDDYDEMTSLIWVGQGPGQYTTPHDFARANGRTPLVPGAIRANYTKVNKFEYTIEGMTLLHRWEMASVDNPIDVKLVYTPNISSLEAGSDDLFNAYTALYESAVYHEACKFLLEEERAAYFDSEYAKYLDSAQTEQRRRQFAGSPLKMQMPRRDVS